ncbi:MAG: hypothetical protein AB1921_01190 [Thermodesulfobacteriota bacterium]
MRVNTSCAHCGEPMELVIDQDMNLSGPCTDPSPVVFVPRVDVAGLKDPNIISAF